MSDIRLLRKAIEASGLPIRRFATEVLMRNERTVWRWLGGDRPIPEAVRKFLESYPPSK